MAPPHRFYLFSPLLLLAALAVLFAVASHAAAITETEPNNDPASANNITINFTYSGAYDYGDDDYFRVLVPGPGLFNVSISVYWPVVELRYGGNGSRIDAYPFQVSSGFEISAAFPAAQFVLVHFGTGSSTDYSFTAHWFAGFAAIEGPDETEYNSDPAHAQNVTFGAHYQGLVDSHFPVDGDWWRIDLPGPGLFTLTFDGSYYYSATVFDEPSLTVLTLGQEYVSSSLVRQGLTATGVRTIALRFTYSYYADTSYGFSAAFTADFSSIQGPQEVELNNDAATATPMPLGTSVSGYYSSLYQDVDYWALNISEAGILSGNSSAGAFVRFANATGGPVGDFGTRYDTSGYSYGLVVSGPASIVLWVAGYGNSAPYTLYFEFTPGYGPIEGAGETEFNNAPETANALALLTPTSGIVDDLFADVDYWNVSAPGPGILSLDITNCCAGPAVASLFLSWSDVPLQPGTWSSTPGSTTLNLIVDGPATVLLKVSPYHANTTYWITASFQSGFAALEGGNETELNNRYATAQPFEPGVEVAGAADSAYNDFDLWTLPSAPGGVGGIEFSSTSSYCNVAVTDPRAKILGQSYGGYPPQVTFQFDPGTPVFVNISSTYGRCAYAFTAQTGDSTSILSRGAGETEPNDDVAHGTRITAAGTYRGLWKQGLDPVDFYRIDTGAGVVTDVTVNVDNPYGYALIAWAEGPGLASPAEYGTIQPPWSVHLLLAPGQVFAFSIAFEYYDNAYTVEVATRPTGVYDDGVLSLAELPSLPVGLQLEASSPNSYEGPNFTIDGTERTLYGAHLCAQTNLSNIVPGVLSERGRTFDPVAVDTRSVVSVAEATVELRGSAGDCFTVEALPSGARPILSYLYTLGGLLTGDAAAVVRASEAGGRADAAAMLALWAVTSNVTRGDLEAWKADPAAVEDANSILASAGLSARLPIPAPSFDQPPPPPPPHPVTNGTLAVAPPKPVTFGEAVTYGAALGGVGALALVAALIAGRRPASEPAARPAAAATASLFCTVCGTSARPGFRACYNCGNVLAPLPGAPR